MGGKWAGRAHVPGTPRMSRVVLGPILVSSSGRAQAGVTHVVGMCRARLDPFFLIFFKYSHLYPLWGFFCNLFFI